MAIRLKGLLCPASCDNKTDCFRTSLFITCSCLYAFLLVIICLAFLTSEVVTDNSPLHYYEGFFSFLYLLSIFFLFYVFCYLLHESTCCRADPEPATYFQVSWSK